MTIVALLAKAVILAIVIVVCVTIIGELISIELNMPQLSCDFAAANCPYIFF